MALWNIHPHETNKNVINSNSLKMEKITKLLVLVKLD